MTRINLIPPSELADQHLLAEWREIKMVPASLRRSLKTKKVKDILASVPSQFVLGTGHVKFFFDKHKYLADRYEILTKELISRGYNIYHTGSFSEFCHGIPNEFFNDYSPDAKALEVIRARITEKINRKPDWYRYRGQPYTSE